MAEKRTQAEKAQELAEWVGLSVEPWMLWEGWDMYAGCARCREQGPKSPCWGRAGCHGYENDCGCQECGRRAARECVEAIKSYLTDVHGVRWDEGGE